MRKVIGVICLAGLLLAIGTGAMAATASWTFKLACTTTSFTSPTTMTLGTGASFTDGKDASGDVNLGTSIAVANPMLVSVHRDTEVLPAGSNPYGAGTTYWKSDMRGVIDTSLPYTSAKLMKSWDMRLYSGTGFTPSVIRLSWWTTTGLPASVASVDPLGQAINIPYYYQMKVYDAQGVAIFSKRWNDGIAVTAQPSAANGIAQYVDITGFNKLSNVSDIDAQGLKVTFEAVPEPGSLLALGSGLVGLVGFAIRRRRA